MQNRGLGCFFVWEKRTYEYKGRVRVTVQNARILHGKRNFDVSTDLPMFDGKAVLTDK